MEDTLEDQLDIGFLKSLLGNWNIEVTDVYPDVWIAGSPERTLRRMVFIDPEGKMFILEEISSAAIGRKREIAGILAELSGAGLKKVHPYRTDRQGEVISRYDGRCWQLREYLQGVMLPRPDYLEDAWRGEVLADFLIALHKISKKDLADAAAESFSIIRFINDFIRKLDAYRTDIRKELDPVLDYLEAEFFPVHDTLPRAFCHGDYHPLNVIWSEEDILSVIDWEFCGTKPEAYDLALLIGCIGIEDPQTLKGHLVRKLLHRIEQTGIYHEQSWTYLLHLVMALRFAWLSEWLRKKDEEMVRLELDYLGLLLANKTKIESIWQRVLLK